MKHNPAPMAPVLQCGYSTPFFPSHSDACDQIYGRQWRGETPSAGSGSRTQLPENAACGSIRKLSAQGRKLPDGRLDHMQGGFLIRHSRLTALGIMLCLLAALFAVEAKIAWFSPAGSASAQISFAKARPAEPPKTLPQRLVSPAPAYDFAGAATLVVLALLLVTTTWFVAAMVPTEPQVSASFNYCASLFFRPPPAL
jgi:hypothetical protein